MRESSIGPGGNGPRVRRPVALSRVLAGARFIGCDDIEASRCQDEASRCRPGDLFVARTAAGGDGHESVPLALARGASAVVAERIVPTDGLPLCLVKDADEAHARLCHALAGDPSRALRVIAVAGTSGKTTTAWLTAAVLAEAGHRVGVLSDLGCLGPDDVEAVRGDVSSAASLAERLAWLASTGCSHAIVEVSSRMLAAQVTAGMVSDTVAVTGLATAHLGRHGTPRAYRDIITRVMRTLTADGCLVASSASAAMRRLAAAGPAAASFLSAGLGPAAAVHARPIDGSLHGRTFLLSAGGQLAPVSVDTPTVPFVRDAVLAAAIGCRYGVTLEHAARGIESAGAVPGRLERLDRGQDAAVFVDSPTSMHAVASSLASLRRLAPRRLVMVAERRLAERLAGRSFSRRVSRWADACLVVPASVAADDPTPGDVAAYARLDRLLSSLGAGDCAVVMGSVGRSRRPDGPPGGRHALGTIVDGWLQLAHPAAAAWAGRRAA